MIIPQNKPYDVAIIGGGVAGAAIARETALRGASVLLVEKFSFGSGTSSRSSRLIHGGIRYLEVGWSALKKGRLTEFARQICFVYSALKECRLLGTLAPDLAKPIPLLIPIYKSDPRHPLTIYAGCCFYYLLGLLAGGAHAPRFFWNARQVSEHLPQLRKTDLLGGVQIWDRLTDDQALVQRLIKSAQNASATCLEYADLKDWSTKDSKGYHTLNISHDQHSSYIKAKYLINATGPWLDQVRKRNQSDAKSLISPVAGAHIVLAPFIQHSCLLQAKDKRIFFCINTPNGCRVGTTERKHSDPETVKATEYEIDYLMKSLNYYFPDSPLTKKDILSQDAGIRPLAKPENNVSDHATSREHHITEDADGVLHVAGVKLTDHRRAAKDVVDHFAKSLHRVDPNFSINSTTHKEPF